MKRDSAARDAAALVARAVVGGSIAAHGAQKLFGWFDGPGMKGTVDMMKSLGFRPADRYARLAAMTELASGTLIALGALGPVGPAALASVMTTAVASVHLPKGYFNTNGGFEMNAMYAMAGLLLATNGYGRVSIDEALGLRDKVPSWLSMAAFFAGIGSGIAAHARRSPDTPPSVVIGEVEPSERSVESSFAPGM